MSIDFDSQAQSYGKNGSQSQNYSQSGRGDSCNISAYSDTGNTNCNRDNNLATSMMHYQALVTDGYINKVDRMKQQQYTTQEAIEEVDGNMTTNDENYLDTYE